MTVTFTKAVNKNKNNRIEFWLNDFDYIDGGDLLAKLFCQKFDMESEEKLDHIYFSRIRLHSNEDDYDIIWHEDMGNSIYSIQQDQMSIERLQERLQVVLDQLNDKLKNIP